jgi:superfamily II DNA/RNA helicase
VKTNLNAKKVCDNLFFYFTQQREESASITGYLLQEKVLTLLKNFNEGKYDSTVTTD